MTGNFLFVLEILKKITQQKVAEFAEKSSYDHIQLVQFGILLTASQDSFQNQHYQQHLEREEGQITDQINENVMHITEYHEMNKVNSSGEQDKQNGQQNKK
jgi:hypothetical protein